MKYCELCRSEHYPMFCNTCLSEHCNHVGRVAYIRPVS